MRKKFDIINAEENPYRADDLKSKDFFLKCSYTIKALMVEGLESTNMFEF